MHYNNCFLLFRTLLRMLYSDNGRFYARMLHSLFPQPVTHPWLLHRCCGSYEATEIRNFYSGGENYSCRLVINCCRCIKRRLLHDFIDPRTISSTHILYHSRFILTNIYKNYESFRLANLTRPTSHPNLMLINNVI